jgi:hypothetical protein
MIGSSIKQRISHAVPYDVWHRKDAQGKHVAKWQWAITSCQSSCDSIRESDRRRSSDVSLYVRLVIAFVFVAGVVEIPPNASLDY